MKPPRFGFLALLALATSLVSTADLQARRPQTATAAPAPLNTQLFYGSLIVSEHSKQRFTLPTKTDSAVLPASFLDLLVPLEDDTWPHIFLRQPRTPPSPKPKLEPKAAPAQPGPAKPEVLENVNL